MSKYEVKVWFKFQVKLDYKRISTWIKSDKMRLPVLSLVTQFCRQLTTPLSRKIVKYAKVHPFFRKYFLILPGRFYHWCEFRTKLLFDNNKVKKSKMQFPPLDDVAAEEIGTQGMIEVKRFQLSFIISFLKFHIRILQNIKVSALENFSLFAGEKMV